MRRLFFWSGLFALGCIVSACGGDTTVEDGEGGAPPREVDTGLCVTDAECSDGQFCNGVELCEPSNDDADERGCIAGRFPPVCDDGVDCTSDACSALLGRCTFVPPDADGDGHLDADCEGDDRAVVGDDCDDDDPNRYPGNAEFCDTERHDEDCDLSTYGERDQDGDGEFDAECGNKDGRELVRGSDCNDRSIAQRSKQPEFCDDIDNDCNGDIDDDAKPVPWYPDEDQDLFGAYVDDPEMSCSPISGKSILPTDCDDDAIGISPVQPEACDFIDNDCDGFSDELPVCELGGSIIPGGGDGGSGGVSSGGSGGVETGGTGGVGTGGSGGVETGGTGSVGTGGSGTGGTPNEPGCGEWLFGAHAVRDDGIILHVAAAATQSPIYDEDGIAPLDGFVNGFQGPSHACGVRDTGEVLCWPIVATTAANGNGQLGRGTSGDAPPVFRAAPVLKPGNIPFTDGNVLAMRSSGNNNRNASCAIDEAEHLWCWGDLTYLANGGSAMNSPYAVEIKMNATDPLTGVVQVALGGSHACVVRDLGTPELWCWGLGTSYQLGDATTGTATYAKHITAIVDPVRAIAAENGTCSLLSDGTAKCWGSNSWGNLGLATASNPATTPSLVRKQSSDPLSDVTNLSLTNLAGAYSAAGSAWYSGYPGQNYAGPYLPTGSALIGVLDVQLVDWDGNTHPRTLLENGDYYIGGAATTLNCSDNW
jgi:hypothetical protein